MIGTAFQGSDIDVSNRSARQVMFIQAVLTLLFNTFIVAWVINVVFDALTTLK
jgi:uncharacterized membrane protein